MKNDIEYYFDFQTPGRVELRCQGKDRPTPEVDLAVKFFVNDSAIANEFSSVVDSLLADAIDVAVAAHIADRLALRERPFATGDGPFNRRMRLQVAVRNPEVWGAEDIQRNLVRTLEYLTQDLWEFEFTQCSCGRASDQQQHLFGKAIPELLDVGLFSGGLDSFAGTAAAFDEGGDRHFIGVSASPSNIHAGRQSRQFYKLQSEFGRHGSHVSIRYSMMEGSRLSQERTRRTRGFVFLILGCVVARSTNAARLHVYENGIGAINLPYDLSQVGIDNTRAMHPRTLRNVATLVSKLTGTSFSIENRSLLLTKGQMCSHPSLGRVADFISDTFSCDGWTHAGAHCGYCTSCLLRRQGLEFAGLTARDTDQYLNDCTSGEWKPIRGRLRGLSAMTWQATRLERCLNSACPWRELVSEFPELQTAANELGIERDEDLVRQSLLRLYRSYVDEWFRFSGLRHLPMRLAA
jgi:7-cyano-7-deazaguanine synthase in queuosine biosynthesis